MRKSRAPAYTIVLLACVGLAGVASEACGGSSKASPTGTNDLPDAAPDDAASAPPADGATTADASDAGTAADAPDKAAACAKTFGDQLVSGYGRLDGTVLAVIPPADNACAAPNSTHLILEVTMNGAAYRIVVNVLSDRPGGDPRVQMKELDAPLVGGAWNEGWHLPGALDYPSALGVHDKDFTPYDQAPVVQRITDAITVGDSVSVFATNDGTAYKDSAHLIHYNGGNQDGAIVLGATTATPKWLLFHFSNQVF